MWLATLFWGTSFLVTFLPSPSLETRNIFATLCSKHISDFESGGGTADHLTGSPLTNWCILETMVSLVLLYLLSFLSNQSLNGYDTMNDPIPLRLSWIWTFAMFWCLKRYYMIITDILWCDLHLNTPVTDHMPSMCCLIACHLSPCSIWNVRHAWTLPLTPRPIMIMHQREREPMTSAHWPCKHDICPAVCHLNNCLVTQVLSATRYVKTSRKFIIHPRHGSYGRLEEEKRVCLTTSSICDPSRSWP